MAENMEVAENHTPLRILYVITKANWGGAQRYVFDVATAAKDAGHEVLVVSGGEGELTLRLEDAGIAVKTLATMQRDVRLLNEVSAFFGLLHTIHTFKPDVIHGNSSKAGGLAAFAGRLMGTRKILFTAHGWAFNEDRPLWQKFIIGYFHYATAFLATRTICVSEALARDIAWMPLLRSRISVIVNGIAPFTLLPREDARAGIAPTHTAPLWIGTIAELHPTKQLHVLIEAFAQIAELHPYTALVIMGEGSERERLTTLIETYGLQDRVALCGHVENAASYLAALDIFVLPSRSEGLGYVLLEAGLASLPVVGSNVGGIPEVVRDRESGLLVPSGDQGALAGALELLIGNERLRNELGHALYERAVRVFSLDRMVRETLARYC